MEKMTDVMVEKREKKRPGLFRRGCSLLVRALFQCVMPCCHVGRRRRGRGGSNKAATPTGDADGPRDEELTAAVDHPSEDGGHRTYIESHVVTRRLTFFPSTTISCYYIRSKRFI